MTIHPLTPFLLPETFAICQFAPGTPFPEWVQTNSFFSVTSTSEELSRLPDGVSPLRCRR